MRASDHAGLLSRDQVSTDPGPTPRERARELLAMAARFDASLPELRAAVDVAEGALRSAKRDLRMARAGAAEARRWAAELLQP